MLAGCVAGVMMEEEKIYAERPNKTKIKREMLALRELGKRMTEMSVSQLDQLPLPDYLYDAVVAARKLKREALRRQLLHIEKLMRDLDVQPVRDAMDALMRPHQQEVEAFHEVEQWRDRLIAGDNDLVNELVERFSVADRQYIRQLVRNANRETKLRKPPKSSRVLFKYLTDLHRNP
jgi:ribosome-associated protein